MSSRKTQNIIEYATTTEENRIGTNANRIEIKSDEPLPVDGTVFVPLPEPEGLFGVDGELPGDAAVHFKNICARISTKDKTNGVKLTCIDDCEYFFFILVLVFFYLFIFYLFIFVIYTNEL